MGNAVYSNINHPNWIHWAIAEKFNVTQMTDVQNWMKLIYGCACKVIIENYFIEIVESGTDPKLQM